MPELSTMGNLWHRISGGGKGMTPPRTLDELLRDIVPKGGCFTLADADRAIRDNRWASHFVKDFLEKRRMQGKVTALRFLVLTHQFGESVEAGSDGEDEEITFEGDRNANQKGNDDGGALARVAAEAWKAFFSEGSEAKLSLSNQALFEALCRCCERLSEPRHPSADRAAAAADAARLIRLARRDPNVRKNGLDPKFTRWLATVDPSTLACLLSIL